MEINVAKELKNVREVLYDNIPMFIMKKLKKYNCIIAGGSIRDIILNQIPKDYDIFFSTKEEYEDFTCYIIKKKVFVTKTEFCDPDQNIFKFELNNGIKFDVINCNIDMYNQTNFTIIIDEFDYTINSIGYSVKFDRFYHSAFYGFSECISDIKELKLRLQGLFLPSMKLSRSLSRLYNLYEKGFKFADDNEKEKFFDYFVTMTEYKKKINEKMDESSNA